MKRFQTVLSAILVILIFILIIFYSNKLNSLRSSLKESSKENEKIMELISQKDNEIVSLNEEVLRKSNVIDLYKKWMHDLEIEHINEMNTLGSDYIEKLKREIDKNSFSERYVNEYIEIDNHFFVLDIRDKSRSDRSDFIVYNGYKNQFKTLEVPDDEWLLSPTKEKCFFVVGSDFDYVAIIYNIKLNEIIHIFRTTNIPIWRTEDIIYYSEFDDSIKIKNDYDPDRVLFTTNIYEYKLTSKERKVIVEGTEEYMCLVNYIHDEILYYDELYLPQYVVTEYIDLD